MIEVGDLVRIKNKHLRAGALYGMSRTRHRGWKQFRGKQVVARVVQLIHPGSFDQVGRWSGAVYELDMPNRNRFGTRSLMNEYWLQLHRKNRRRERAPQGAAGS